MPPNQKAPAKSGAQQENDRIFTSSIIEEPGYERSNEIRKLLDMIIKIFTPVLTKRNLKVGHMQEFFPRAPTLFGLNHNRGHLIEVRYRDPSDKNKLLRFEQIIKTTAHEITHNLRGPHDDVFFRIMGEILVEAEKVIEEITPPYPKGHVATLGNVDGTGVNDPLYARLAFKAPGQGVGIDTFGRGGRALCSPGQGFAFTAGSAAGNRVGGRQSNFDPQDALIRNARLAKLGVSERSALAPDPETSMRDLMLRGMLKRMCDAERRNCMQAQQQAVQANAARRAASAPAAGGRGAAAAAGSTGVLDVDAAIALSKLVHPTCGVRDAGNGDSSDHNHHDHGHGDDDDSDVFSAPLTNTRQNPTPAARAPASKASDIASLAAAAAARRAEQKRAEQQAQQKPQTAASSASSATSSALLNEQRTTTTTTSSISSSSSSYPSRFFGVPDGWPCDLCGRVATGSFCEYCCGHDAAESGVNDATSALLSEQQEQKKKSDNNSLVSSDGSDSVSKSATVASNDDTATAAAKFRQSIYNSDMVPCDLCKQLFAGSFCTRCCNNNNNDSGFDSGNQARRERDE